MITTTVVEESPTGKLTFEFSDKWQVYKYDEDNPENFYYKIRGLGLKAVDFIAISEKSILLIEVKYITASNESCRMRLTPSLSKKEQSFLKGVKDKLTDKEAEAVKVSLKRPYLAEEVSKKVKDTLIGLLASYRCADENLQPYSQSLFIGNKPILLVLFLERKECLNQPNEFKPLANNLKLAIEQKTGFLGNIQVDVMNTLTVPPALGVNVINGAGNFD